MRTTLAISLGLSGLLPIALTLAALLGLGLVRDLTPTMVGMGAMVGVMLPVMGLWSLFGKSAEAYGLASWLWGGLLMAGLPAYFPGEIPGALSTGLAAMATPLGPDWVAPAAHLGLSLAGPLEARAPTGTPPPEVAEAVVAPLCPPSPSLGDDQVALPYEGQGHSLAIPVQFGDIELPMLFDTGASVTTLSRASLAKLGISVPADAPEITLRTANGERSTRLVLVPKVWVGGMLVEGVTVGVCEECADSKTAGLLGLNVSGQFLVTVDTVRKEVLFQSRAGEQDRLLDVGHWLDVEATARVFPDTRVDVEVRAHNRAARPVSMAEVEIECGQQRFKATVKEIAPGEAGRSLVSLPRGVDCEPYRVRMLHARW